MAKRALAGQVIVITGASSGIGKATALALAPEKPRLVLVARRRKLLEELLAQVESKGGSALALALDLSQSENVDLMIRRTVERFNRIDVLINNAAFGYYGTVENTPPAIVREIFDLNFEAPLSAMQRVIPIMRRQGGGHIVNVSSVAGKRGLPLSGIYCATKFALNGLSEALRIEVKEDNIHVTIINPAATATEFGQSIREGDVHARFKPVGYVQPAEDVAASIVASLKMPKVEVYPYYKSRLVAWMNALAPSVLDRIVTKFFRERLQARNTPTVSR
jgi:short-subunit dehydrogenase